MSEGKYNKFKVFFGVAVDMLSGLFFEFLIWMGAVMGFVSQERKILALLLVLCGAAYLYKNAVEKYKNNQ